ncbi:MAG: hypothetical protein IT373_24820 [Polyangiaceae bacterium]|nr:hypothetical protein [Polyangiaceae bacterium]
MCPEPSRLVRRLASSFGVVCLGWLGAPAVARADIPPEPGYVESCDVLYAQQPTERCETCGADHRDRAACERKYQGTKSTRRCQTRGASVWQELWCRPLEAGEAPSPAPQALPGRGCACDLGAPSAPGESNGAALLVGLCVAAVVARRRR